MIAHLKSLVSSLREELGQYGEMLARLDEQQELISRRASEGVLESVTSIESQIEEVAKARAARMARMMSLLEILQLPNELEVRQLLPHLPPDYRPLITALVEENNALLIRIQQRTRQNHFLLAHSLEGMQRLMSSLFPMRKPAVYNELGSMGVHMNESCALYEAVG